MTNECPPTLSRFHCRRLHGRHNLAGQSASRACQRAGADEGDARASMDMASTDTRNFRHCATEPVVREICASYFENVQARERTHVNLPAYLDTGVEARLPINSSRMEDIEKF